MEGVFVPKWLLPALGILAILMIVAAFMWWLERYLNRRTIRKIEAKREEREQRLENLAAGLRHRLNYQARWEIASVVLGLCGEGRHPRCKDLAKEQEFGWLESFQYEALGVIASAHRAWQSRPDFFSTGDRCSLDKLTDKQFMELEAVMADRTDFLLFVARHIPQLKEYVNRCSFRPSNDPFPLSAALIYTSLMFFDTAHEALEEIDATC